MSDPGNESNVSSRPSLGGVPDNSSFVNFFLAQGFSDSGRRVLDASVATPMKTSAEPDVEPAGESPAPPSGSAPSVTPAREPPAPESRNSLSSLGLGNMSEFAFPPAAESAAELVPGSRAEILFGAAAGADIGNVSDILESIFEHEESHFIGDFGDDGEFMSSHHAPAAGEDAPTSRFTGGRHPTGHLSAIDEVTETSSRLGLPVATGGRASIAAGASHGPEHSRAESSTSTLGRSARSTVLAASMSRSFRRSQLSQPPLTAPSSSSSAATALHTPPSSRTWNHSATASTPGSVSSGAETVRAPNAGYASSNASSTPLASTAMTPHRPSDGTAAEPDTPFMRLLMADDGEHSPAPPPRLNLASATAAAPVVRASPVTSTSRSRASAAASPRADRNFDPAATIRTPQSASSLRNTPRRGPAALDPAATIRTPPSTSSNRSATRGGSSGLGTSVAPTPASVAGNIPAVSSRERDWLSRSSSSSVPALRPLSFATKPTSAADSPLSPVDVEDDGEAYIGGLTEASVHVDSDDTSDLDAILAFGRSRQEPPPPPRPSSGRDSAIPLTPGTDRGGRWSTTPPPRSPPPLVATADPAAQASPHPPSSSQVPTTPGITMTARKREIHDRLTTDTPLGLGSALDSLLNMSYLPALLPIQESPSRPVATGGSGDPASRPYGSSVSRDEDDSMLPRIDDRPPAVPGRLEKPVPFVDRLISHQQWQHERDRKLADQQQQQSPAMDRHAVSWGPDGQQQQQQQQPAQLRDEPRYDETDEYLQTFDGAAASPARRGSDASLDVSHDAGDDGYARPYSVPPETPVAPRTSVTAVSAPPPPPPLEPAETAHPSLMQALLAAAGGRPLRTLAEMHDLDLSGQHVESFEGLDQYTPVVDSLQCHDNELRFLAGVPTTVSHLWAAHNRLSTLTSFHHLEHLHSLDISHNHVNDLIGLSCLRHLRLLVADNNGIGSWLAVPAIESLETLSLRDNNITSIDGAACRLPSLRHLDLAHNTVSLVANLDHLPELKSLVLDANALVGDMPGFHPHLEALDVTDNLLTGFDARRFPAIRVVRLDGNAVRRIDLEAIDGAVDVSYAHQGHLSPAAAARRERDGARRRHRSVSGSSTGSGASPIPQHHRGDVEDEDLDAVDFVGLQSASRLSLAGNVVASLDPMQHMYQLVHLDLSGCGLRALPAKFGRHVPSLRTLDLSQNCVHDVSPLSKVARLRWLSLRGNDVADFFHVAAFLGHLTRLEWLDVRQNPLTALFYPNVPGSAPAPAPPAAASASARGFGSTATDAGATGGMTDAEWNALDARYLVTLNDSTQVKRTCYRTALLYHLRASLQVLDRVPISAADRADAPARYRRMERSLQQIMARGATPPPSTAQQQAPRRARGGSAAATSPSVGSTPRVQPVAWSDPGHAAPRPSEAQQQQRPQQQHHQFLPVPSMGSFTSDVHDYDAIAAAAGRAEPYWAQAYADLTSETAVLHELEQVMHGGESSEHHHRHHHRGNSGSWAAAAASPAGTVIAPSSSLGASQRSSRHGGEA
ncbi:Protein nud1 [Blastocladiella emersonii ATCC 22665]|nr:Protein nud1 [Blastocladiella emersonii ATCC 22665]